MFWVIQCWKKLEQTSGRREACFDGVRVLLEGNIIETLDQHDDRPLKFFSSIV